MNHDPHDETTIELSGELNSRITRHSNIDQSIISITEDKTELILRDYLQRLEDKKSWTIPLSILLTLIVIPVTTEKFRPFLFSAESWKAIIYLAIICSFIWFIKTLCKSCKNRKISIEDIIKAMKKAEKNN